ncbi:MAG TPA: hypothetical protein VJZ27_17825, partial [Aggregatilineales bacterium]|nr:hypothetical protein [Aggregatilineales bacterium]
MNQLFNHKSGALFITLLILAIGISISLSINAHDGGFDAEWQSAWLREVSAVLIGVLAMYVGFELIAGRRMRSSRTREYVQDIMREARQGKPDALDYLRERDLLVGAQLQKARL